MVHLPQVHIPVRHVNRFAYNGVAIRYSIILAACLNHIKSDLDSIRARDKLVTNHVLKAVDTGVTGIGLIILNIGWKGWVRQAENCSVGGTVHLSVKKLVARIWIKVIGHHWTNINWAMSHKELSKRD